VRHALLFPAIVLFTLTFCICNLRSSAQTIQTAPAQVSPRSDQPRSPGGNVGSGASDIGKGTAKGAGAAAEGVGKGAGDLVTLHPIDAAGNVGKGAAVIGRRRRRC
jgi:hypothetical protein